MNNIFCPERIERIMSYFPLTKEDQAEMLEAVGIERFSQLLQAIPPDLRNPKIDLPPALSELEAQDFFAALASQNANVKRFNSFLGAGSYEHYIPAVVPFIINRSEFYTAYTPYQPEASQGILQALFEYQSLMCELTGMDVSNGSHYDGASALAESVLMALHHTGREKALVAQSVHPEYRTVTGTYLHGTNFHMDEFSFKKGFALDTDELKKKLNETVGAVVVQSPNFFGLAEDLTELERLTREAGALLILVAHPLSFGFYKSAGEWNADIACGEGQPLGIPPGFGGPGLGYIAVTKALVRRIPGRLVGLTTDSEGRRAFCLTLQAREQHIRRERATSNICSNQALCAISAGVYLSTLGKAGVKRIAELNIENAMYLRDALARLKSAEVLTQGPVFNEFAVRFNRPVSEINQKLFERGITGGLGLERFYPERQNEMLICATETKSKEQLDQFVEAVKSATQGN